MKRIKDDEKRMVEGEDEVLSNGKTMARALQKK